MQTEDLPALLDRLERLTREAATTLGQPALDAAMLAAQAQAATGVIRGFVCAGIVVAGCFAYRALWRATGAPDGDDIEEPAFMIRTAGGCVLATVGAWLTFAAVAEISDASAWLAAFDGRVALALKLLN